MKIKKIKIQMSFCATQNDHSGNVKFVFKSYQRFDLIGLMYMDNQRDGSTQNFLDRTLTIRKEITSQLSNLSF